VPPKANCCTLRIRGGTCHFDSNIFVEAILQTPSINHSPTAKGTAPDLCLGLLRRRCRRFLTTCGGCVRTLVSSPSFPTLLLGAPGQDFGRLDPGSGSSPFILISVSSIIVEVVGLLEVKYGGGGSGRFTLDRIESFCPFRLYCGGGGRLDELMMHNKTAFNNSEAYIIV